MSVSRLLLVGASAAVVMAACGSPSQSPAVPAPSPVTNPPTTVDDGETDGDAVPDPDGDWIATSGVTNGIDIALIAGSDVTVSIDGDQISGTAACNGYGGDVTIGADGTFAVGEVFIQEMGCEPPIQAVEQAFVAALGSFVNYTVHDDVLTLSGPSDEWVFDRLAPIDDAAFVGTTWVLDTYIDGDVASNMPLMESATLMFADDGRLSGSTGCRRLEGEWIAADGRISFMTLAAIDDPAAGQCAPDGQTLDELVVGVLESGVTVEVDGNRLTMTSAGGAGLSYAPAG